MKQINPDTLLIVGGIGVAVLAVLWLSRSGNAATVGQTVGEAAVSTIVGAGTGVVLGASEAVGIPRTNQTECERAIAEGRTWDASFACPAGTFIKSLF